MENEVIEEESIVELEFSFSTWLAKMELLTVNVESHLNGSAFLSFWEHLRSLPNVTNKSGAGMITNTFLQILSKVAPNLPPLLPVPDGMSSANDIHVNVLTYGVLNSKPKRKAFVESMSIRFIPSSPAWGVVTNLLLTKIKDIYFTGKKDNATTILQGDGLESVVANRTAMIAHFFIDDDAQVILGLCDFRAR